MSAPQRISSFCSAVLSAVLVLAAGWSSAQSAVATELFVLPQGLSSTTYSWSIPLPPGRSATLSDFTLTTKAGTALPAELRYSIPEAATFNSFRQPLLNIYFEVSRSGGDDELQLLGTATYVTTSASSLSPRNGPQEPFNSVLATGKIAKLAVDEDGIYQIDAGLLEELGLSTSSSPANVRLYSKGGAMLPERVGDSYPVDLQEVALQEVGNGDNKWDSGERLLFYGQGEDVWLYDTARQDFARRENLYAEKTYYYLKVEGQGARINTLPQATAATYDQQYTNRVRWEEEQENLLYFSKQRYSGQGSGQQWFGPQFGTNRQINRPALFNLGTLVPGATGRLTSRFAASTLRSGTKYSVSVNGQTFTSESFSRGVRGDANSAFAHFENIGSPIRLNEPVVDVEISYPGSFETSVGWIDYVQLTYPCLLRYAGQPLPFRSLEHTNGGSYGFEVANTPADFVVYDISDPLRPAQVRHTNGRFAYSQEALGPPREFIGFDESASYAKPEVIGGVTNTNLHAIRRANMLIVYGEGLEQAANQLAEHRREHNDYTVVTAEFATIAEEFGGGRPDPTAIRAFAKTLYERDPNFEYLLLLGDGTFDPRGIKRPEGNLVPTYQTYASNHEVTAYPADDYFALLDDGEGKIPGINAPRGGLDVGVGRIPASTATQANTLVNKIVRYESDPELLGNWRLRNVFVADDEDFNVHLRDMDEIARRNAELFPDFNQVKIYADAYEQVPTTGGVRFPRAAEAINLNMFRGNLLTTYLGHGGPNGWGQERFLNAPDIEKWDSRDAYTVLVTATCTFTGFDDPERTVAGEQVLFKRGGGAVASLSTVRPVLISVNKTLAKATHKVLLNDSLAVQFGVGKLLALAKNSTSDSENDRKYSLFGDPAMRLAVPTLNVVVTEFDSVVVATQPDTVAVEAMREVTVKGIITDRSDNFQSNFSGEVLLTIFDQERVARTLGQDPRSEVEEFVQQGNTLFSGRASVVDGRWEAKFRLPKDLALGKGAGRLSMYALSPDGRDGSGLFNRFIIDGLAAPTVADDTPPVVEVFIGDDAFISGGITGDDPVVLAKLSDDYGINVSGASIGHDLTASLRGRTEDNYVLNDFYEAATDDYRRGEVRYPIFDLPEGEYDLSVRAWDLANNTGVGTTSFVVSADPGVALKRVLNYPNPFVDATCFQFEHTAAGQLVEVQIDIYTSSGRRVTSIRHEGVARGNRFGNDDCISWDGTDDFGQELARGVYLYKVRLRTEDGERSGQSDFERLVVLK